MTQAYDDLSSLSRPRILVRAARFAAGALLRRRQAGAATETKRPYGKLLAEEAALDHARRQGDAGYSPTRHVEVLSALLVEAGYGALTSL